MLEGELMSYCFRRCTSERSFPVEYKRGLKRIKTIFVELVNESVK